MDVVSIGSSTHTRVDSAAKHIRQCKIHERLMVVWLGGPQGQEAMHRQKNKYATMKDDLVLNVNESLGVLSSHTDAYPSPTDVAQAPDPDWHYVIVSLRDDLPSLRSYRIVDGEITEEQVTLAS